MTMSDLIKTIEDDDDDIPNFSEESRSDDERETFDLIVEKKKLKKKKLKKGPKSKSKEEVEEEEEDKEFVKEIVRIENPDEELSDEEILEEEERFTKSDITFQQMSLSRPLLKAIASLGYVHPTPIQCAAIPIALAGRDVCGCAATGTGKTAAYMLPVLERLLFKPKSIAVTRVLCLVPTRELGAQVYKVAKQLTSFSKDIEIALAVGGLDMKSQEAILRKNPDIVIATPGRLIDHLGNTPTFSLDSIEILILDEADRMLDEWFAEQLKEIVRQCSPKRQTLLFSATMTDRVKDLATVSLKNPSKIFVDSNKQVAFNLRQQIVRVRNETDREPLLCSLIVRSFRTRTIIFVATKKAAHRLHIMLELMGVKIGELHGDLTQPKRLENLKKFETTEFDVLIATDVAARGLDIPNVRSVINFTMPPTLEQYIHRCGRTARAGKSGVAVTLVGESDRRIMKEVAKRAVLPIKSRIISAETIGNYRDKVDEIKPQIDSALKEEEAQKSIFEAEKEVEDALKTLNAKKSKKERKKAKKMAENKEDSNKRVWFQTAKERADENNRLKGRLDPKERKAKFMDEQDFKIKNMTEFQARDAKRKQRNAKSKNPAKGGGFMANNGEPPAKRAKKKSHFDEELTNTKRAKEFRHQPNRDFGGKKGGGGGGGKKSNKRSNNKSKIFR